MNLLDQSRRSFLKTSVAMAGSVPLVTSLANAETDDGTHPLIAKLPCGAWVAVVGPIFPASFLMSVAVPNRPSFKIGSTETEPPK